MSTGPTAISRDPKQPTTITQGVVSNTLKLFPQFALLPDELCLMILQERLVTELITPIRTITIVYWQPYLLTRGIRYEERGLWHTGNSLIRSEIERRSILIPARQLAHPGTNIYYMDKGLTSFSCEQYREMGVRPTPKNTVFYMAHETALHVFKLLQERSIDAWKFEWLGSLLLNNQTFRALVRQFSTEGSRGRLVSLVQLFELLPNLRTLYLGFARRWTEVVLVEGLVAADVLIPVHVPEISHDDTEQESQMKWHVEVPDGVQLHEGLKAMIVTTAQESSGEIRALKSAGIEARLVVVRDEGIVRRLDAIRGYDNPDS